MPAPRKASSNTVSRGQNGAIDPIIQDVIELIPTVTVGFSSLGASGLQAIADALPFVDYLPDAAKPGSENQLAFRTPSIAGYDIRAFFSAEFSFGVDFVYSFDFGSINTRALVTSAVSIADNDPEGYAADPDGDLYTNYILDTSLTGIQILLSGSAATSNSYAALELNANAHFGITGVGLYDDGNLKYGGDILNEDFTLGTSIELFNGPAGSEVAAFDNGVLSGKLNIPSLPVLAAMGAEGASGASVYDPVSISGTGPQFASLTLDPIPLIPVLGKINEGDFFLIRSYLVDAGVQWKLITATASIGAALRQSLSAQVTSVGVHAEVKERQNNGSYQTVDVENGMLGDKLELNFSTQDKQNTQIIETYTIDVRVTSSIDLVPILTLDFGIGYLSAFINPILIDELRKSIQLFSKTVPIEIASFKIVDGIGFDVQLVATITTQVDTHLPAVGTQFSDNGTFGPDGLFHPTLELAGNQIAIDGYAGDDIVIGNPSANEVNGGPDNDIIVGGDGADVIHGGPGWDTSAGDKGNDRLYTDTGGTGTGGEGLSGGDGSDSLYISAVPGNFYGDAGDDFIEIYVLGAGGQTVDGGLGSDRMTLHYENVGRGVELNLTGDPTSGTILRQITGPGGVLTGPSTFVGIEQIYIFGSAFDDDFSGSDGYNFIQGNGGNDHIYGYGGNDLLAGGDGNDVILGMDDNDIILGEAGNDVVFGGPGNDNIRGDDGNDTIYADTGQDTVLGGAGNDTIEDSPENINDSLSGGSGDDTVRGGGGSDTIHGNEGNDTLYASTGGGSVFGDAGLDKLHAVMGAILDGGLGSDTYVIDATDLNIRIDDSDSRETLEIFAGDAEDRLVLTGVTSSSTTRTDPNAVANGSAVVFGIDGTLVTFGGQTIGSYAGIESFDLTGSNGDEVWLVEGFGNNRLNGGGGDDFLEAPRFGSNTLIGGSGDDIIVGDESDDIEGGTGTDTLYWRSSRTDQDLSIGDPETPGTEVDGYSTRGNRLTGIERLVMIDSQGNGNDRITGGALDDRIQGAAGDDVLDGRGGDDIIVAGRGGDEVYGGDGNDYINLADFETVEILTRVRESVVNGVLVTETVPIAGDVAYGGSGNDEIAASNTASLIDGGTGDDFITVLDGGFRGDFVTEVQGGDGNDVVQGSSQAELIVGGTEISLLQDGLRSPPDLSDDPGLDDDFIQGFGGNDTIYGGRGNDNVFGGIGEDSVHGGTGNDTVGGDATDRLYGDSGNDRLIFEGPMGEALLDGGTEIDTVSLDLTGTPVAVEFVLEAATRVGELQLINIERLDVRLTNGDDRATGGSLDDVIAGGLGADIIRGGDGNDVLNGNRIYATDNGPTEGDQLYGERGNDMLEISADGFADGGSGVDTLVVKGRNEFFENAQLVFRGHGNFGSIAYTNIEALYYFADRRGTAVKVAGGEGSDLIYATDEDDLIDGGSGQDYLSGYGGDDLLRLRGGRETSFVDGGEGFDTLELDLSDRAEDLYVTLNDGDPVPLNSFFPVQISNIEKLAVATGRGNDFVIAGGGDDDISTGMGDDVVTPGGGTDRVRLGAGNDTLIDLGTAAGVETFFGDAGDDIIRVGNQQVIVEGGDGDDQIFNSERFFYSITPSYADVLRGGAGNDLIDSNSYGHFDGGAGVDRIVNDVTLAGPQRIGLTYGGTVTLADGWSLTGFELYSLTFGARNDDVFVEYGAHVLDGGFGTDSITVYVDSQITAPVTTEVDEFGVETKVFSNGMRLRGFEQLTIEYRTSPAVAIADTVRTTEAEHATIAVLANDYDTDGGPVSITRVGDMPISIGETIRLPSGALVTLKADGTLDYDPNGRFDTLVSAGDAAATGAVNTSAVDLFSYTLIGGNTATATVTIDGVRSVADVLGGTRDNNLLAGTAGNDSYDLSQGGNDTVNGDFGDDGFFFGAAFSAADRVDGGSGVNDQVGLGGNYTGANRLVLGAATLSGVEVIAALPGYSYDIVSNDGNVAAGQTLSVFAGNLLAGNDFRFDGSAETDGSFKIFGGLGNDVLIGGALDDGFYFGPGKWSGGDRVLGGNGANDQLALDGNYTLSIGTSADVETLILLPGPVGSQNTFNITLGDAWTAAAATKTVWGLNVTTDMVINGSAETNGALTLFGGKGSDTLTGGAGADSLYGGGGGDVLRGGGGADVFLYDNIGESFGGLNSPRDSILDFSVGDLIDLSRIDTGFARGDQPFIFIGDAAFSNVAGQLRYSTTGAGTFVVEGDINGDSIVDFSLSVTSATLTPPVAADFIL